MFPRCLRACSLLDAFLVDSAVTSLAFSPTSDFLVTTHVDDLGVYLWSNMTLYEHVSLRPLPRDYEPTLMMMPSTSLVTQGLRKRATSTRTSCGNACMYWRFSVVSLTSQVSERKTTATTILMMTRRCS